MNPTIVVPAMERARDLWPQTDWWGAHDECLSLSFGAGVNTTALSLLLLWMGRKAEHIFSDLGPGAEHPRTVAFVQEYAKEVRSCGCKFTVIAPDSKYRIPSQRMSLLDYIKLHRTTPRMPGPRWCTASWKIEPIQRYSRLKFFGSLIGIDGGESHRASHDAGLFYPLIDADINRHECNEIVDAFGICNPGKSGCMFCPRVTDWYVYQLWQDGLINYRICVEEIPWKAGRNSDDPKEGQIIPLRHNGKLTRVMVAEWERGENIPSPGEKIEDLPCVCRW